VDHEASTPGDHETLRVVERGLVEREPQRTFGLQRLLRLSDRERPRALPRAHLVADAGRWILEDQTRRDRDRLLDRFPLGARLDRPGPAAWTQSTTAANGTGRIEGQHPAARRVLAGDRAARSHVEVVQDDDVAAARLGAAGELPRAQRHAWGQDARPLRE